MSDLTRPKANGNYPPEPKVIATTGTSTGLVALLLTLLNGVQDEDHALLLGNGTPQPVEVVILSLLVGAITYAVGWYTRHQHRRTGVDVPPTVT